jgi:predicted nucleic acid-binding protein
MPIFFSMPVYAEDLQDGQLIENTLKVINPMLHERFRE